MTIRRLTMAIVAVVFAAFSSVAMLQSARPAMADQSWNRASHQQRVADRDDRRRHHHRKVNKGRHLGWNNPHNPHYNGGNPKHHGPRDRDRH